MDVDGIRFRLEVDEEKESEVSKEENVSIRIIDK